jgi:hypothetical protein
LPIRIEPKGVDDMHRTHLLLVTCLALGGCGDSGACPSYMFDCYGICADLMSDTANCGGCGIACPSGQVCSAGVCIVECGEGQELCSGVCRDVRDDIYNCGTCGATCPSGHICFEGACAPDCPEGYTDCTGICRNLDNDPSNCGACGTLCAPGEVCLSGSCSFTCPSPYVDCSGSCADLMNDHNNCGTCGTTCAAGEVCADGLCVTSCYEGLTMCTGECVDLMRDPENCGSCATRCETGDFCYEGACTAACPGGFTDCGGFCVDLDADREHCGTCDTACADGEICEAGVCEATCAAPLTDCPVDTDGDTTPDGEICTDLSNDPANCGTCGTACAGGEACVAGSCEVLDCNYSIYSEAFTSGATATAQCTSWNSWRTTLSPTGCSRVTMRGSLDTTGVTCSDPVTVANIAAALRSASTGSWSCDGRTWQTGMCGSGIELSAMGTTCRCDDPGYIARPCISNSNWGGMGTDTCGAPSQTMEVVFH